MDIVLKTTTHNQKKVVSFKYVKKPCHFFEKHLCELIHVSTEINQKANPMDVPGMEYLFQNREIHKFYLYIPASADDETKLVMESRCFWDKRNNINTTHDFLINVFCFLREISIKDEAQEMELVLARVKGLIQREKKSCYGIME